MYTWSLWNICRMHNYPGKLYKYRGLGLLSSHQWVGVRSGNSFMPIWDAGVCIQIDRKPELQSQTSHSASIWSLSQGNRFPERARVAQNMVLILKCHPLYSLTSCGQCLQVLASSLRQSIRENLRAWLEIFPGNVWESGLRRRGQN